MTEPYRPSSEPPGGPYDSRQYPPPMPPYPSGVPSEPGGPTKRPGTVLAATVLTFVGSGILVLVGLGLLVVLASADSAALQDAINQFGLRTSVEALKAAVIGASIGILVEAALLILGGVLAHTGRNAGRVILTVLGGLNIVLNLVQLATGQAAITVVLIYVVITLVLLWSGSANAWYRERRARRAG